MCLIIHQPPGRTTPLDLLRSAAEHSPDGFGFMGLRSDMSVHVERHTEASLDLLKSIADRFAGRDCAYHFLRHAGCVPPRANLHPFEVGPGLYLMHNGTANVPLRHPGRSDTWHLVNDYLAPLLSHRRRLIYDRAFRSILDQWLGPKNRMVILDLQEQRIEVLTPADGVEWRGLWLSNSRWLDRESLGIPEDDRHVQILRGSQVVFC